MTNKEIFEELKEPFSPEQVEWRLSRKSKDKTKGEVLAYIDGRAIQDRLNSVLGEENWDVTYIPVDMGTITVSTYSGDTQRAIKGFLATINLHLPDGTIASRQDGSGCTDFDPFKGGVSGALKRAASAFGIGRYLYNLPSTWVPIDQYGNFKKPNLPLWALPKGSVANTGEHAKPESPVSGVSDEEYQESLDSLCEYDEVPKQEQGGNVTFTAGKYKGKPVSAVTDFGYLDWVVNKSNFPEPVKQAALSVLDESRMNQPA